MIMSGNAVRFTTVILWLGLTSINYAQRNSLRKCPEGCSCLDDDKGRKTVSCDASRLGNTIPVFDMEKDTKVIIISSLDDQPVSLIGGPIFSTLSELEEVHITRANLPTIGDNSFWGLKHLRTLNLTENNITLVLNSHFNGIKGLENLHLDSNRISNIPSGSFRTLDNLETLTIANNQIPGLTPRMFYLLKNLRTLDLSGNPIVDLDPAVLKDLPYLHTLRCASCVISRVNSLLYKAVPNLETLDLRNNYISYLAPDEYMDLRFLKYLYLDGNKIKDLQDFTFRNRGLHYLGLSRNQLKIISKFTFQECAITTIDLSHNFLDYPDLKHLTPIIHHIHSLNISHNKITAEYLKQILKKAPRLKILNLSHMHISQLPKDLFVSQDKLEILNLSHNHIRFIPADILHSLHSMKELDIRHNGLRGLPEIILRRFDRIKKIHLTDNPWSCDQCHIPHMKMWLNSSKIFRNACKPDIDAPNCLKCMGPREMYDKPIVEIDGLELQPCPEGTLDLAAASEGASEFSLLLAIVTALVVLCLLGIILIVGIIMYNRHSAFYYTHEDEDRTHFYDNPVLHSNHTDVTLEEDLDHPREDVFIGAPIISHQLQAASCSSTDTLRSSRELETAALCAKDIKPKKSRNCKNINEITIRKHNS